MNIALITNNFLPKMGGITNVMVNITKNLREKGEKIYVFNKSMQDENRLYFNVLSNATSFSGILSHNIKFFYFQFFLIFKILFSIKKISLRERIKLITFYCFYPKFIVRRIISIKNLVKYLKKNEIDIILSGSANIPLFYSYILSKWFKIPMLTIAHGDDFIVQNPLKIKTHILNNIQGIVVTNRIMKKLMLKVHQVNSDKINIIHLGVDINSSKVEESVSELRNKFGIKNNDFIILTVSRFYPRKGFDTVVRAIKLIIDNKPEIPIKYFIIGDGEERENIEYLIKQLNLENNVILLGAVDDITKNQYYTLSDVFVLVPEVKKNSIEGFGIVYIEANFFKLPVIGSRTGGVKIAIEDGKSGFLINPKDINDLKEKIMMFYNDDRLRQDIGEYGHKRVIKDFNWKINALLYLNIFERILNTN